MYELVTAGLLRASRFTVGGYVGNGGIKEILEIAIFSIGKVCLNRLTMAFGGQTGRRVSGTHIYIGRNPTV
ncbi:hypothetical protein [Rhizobium mesoamericanum]|uniref:hypothetical protein n=1 Tax=Rhizobium mesoamericanum TaxID=1079800 RepID=UPI000414AFFC|nr:hypothetical protein [Rhizobium mesoamericanum]